MHILNLLQGDLKTFFELYQGEVKLCAYGDSQVVLSQLLRDSYYFKVWVAIRVSEIQSLVGAIVPQVEFFHIPGALNAADILTRPYKGSPRDLPYIHNCEIDTNSATPYNESRTELHELPELNRKQVHTNVSCLDSGKLNNDPAGEVNIEYIMLYNKMKCTPDLLAPKISSIIEDLMAKYSRWESIKNVLA